MRKIGERNNQKKCYYDLCDPETVLDSSPISQQILFLTMKRKLLKSLHLHTGSQRHNTQVSLKISPRKLDAS